MKKRFFRAILVAVLCLSLLSGTVLAYLYRSSVAVTENASSSYDMLAVSWNQANQWMDDNGFFGTGVNTTRVQSLGGLNYPHLVSDNRVLTALSVAANSQTNLFFVTGESEVSAMDIIVGYGGYITIPDDPTLELGDNFTVELDGWIDTTGGSNENLVHKIAAFRTYVSGSGNITSISANNTYLSFITNDFVERDSQLVAAYPFTMEQWVNTSNLTHTGTTFCIVDKDEVGNDQYFTIGIAAGQAQLVARNVAIESISSGAGTIVAGRWHHIVGVFSSATSRTLYLDGVDVGSDADNVAYDADIDRFSIGRNGRFTPTAYFDGLIDETRFYSTNLTAGNVLYNYNQGPTNLPQPYSTADLEGWWHIDEGAGAITYDETANNYDGTINGATWHQSNGATVVATGVSSGEHLVTSSREAGNIYSQTTSWNGFDVYAARWGGQTFTVDSGVNYLTSVSVYLAKTGAPADTFVVALRATSGGLPTGANLVSDTLATAGIGTATYTFDLDYELQASTQYAIVCYLQGAGGDAGNFIRCYWSDGSTVADGTFVNSVNGGVDWSTSAGDIRGSMAEDTFGILIDSVGQDSTLGTAVLDNANDVTLFQDDSVPYADYMSFSIGGTEVTRYEPSSMILGTVLPDEIGSNDAVITWGANPTGVGATIGSMSSAGQPDIGVASDTSTVDLLPVTGGTDWRPVPTVSAALQANPMRPIVTAVSDNTTLSEYQVWVWLGAIFVVLVFAITARSVRGHHLITGLATSAAIALMVVWTVFPLWVLTVVVLAIWRGLVSERTHAL